MSQSPILFTLSQEVQDMIYKAYFRDCQMRLVPGAERGTDSLAMEGTGVDLLLTCRQIRDAAQPLRRHYLNATHLEVPILPNLDMDADDLVLSRSRYGSRTPFPRVESMTLDVNLDPYQHSRFRDQRIIRIADSFPSLTTLFVRYNTHHQVQGFHADPYFVEEGLFNEEVTRFRADGQMPGEYHPETSSHKIEEVVNIAERRFGAKRLAMAELSVRMAMMQRARDREVNRLNGNSHLRPREGVVKVIVETDVHVTVSCACADTLILRHRHEYSGDVVNNLVGAWRTLIHRGDNITWELDNGMPCFYKEVSHVEDLEKEVSNVEDVELEVSDVEDLEMKCD